MTYHHLLWIVNLDTAGVLHCVILLCSAKGRFWCLLSKMSLMLQSLTWRMLVHLIIWKKKKNEKQKTLNPVVSPCVFSLYASNFSWNIHLSLLMMAETPHSQEWWPEWPSKPVSLLLTGGPFLSARDLLTSLRRGSRQQRGRGSRVCGKPR